MNDDRILPHSLDFESAVLYAGLTESGTVDRCNMLQPEHFYSSANANVWRSIVQVAARGSVPSVVSVRDELVRVGRFAASGGDEYLYSLIASVIPTSDVELTAREIVALSKRREVIVTCFNMATLGYDRSFDTTAYFDLAAHQIIATTKGAEPTGVFSRNAIRFSGEWVRNDPPPREYTFEIDDGEGSTRGYLPHRVVGVTAGEGGAGKSYMMLALGVAVATGKPCWGVLHPSRTGSVLIAAGEEHRDEIVRRVHAVCRAAKVSEKDIALMEARIVVVPLSGQVSQLVARDAEGNARHTEALADLQRFLSEREDWALVILDPLSRLASDDAETDNAAATRTIEALETIVNAAQATVLVAHHTSKAARGGGQVRAEGVRGSSALVDGSRWVATLSQEDRGELRTVTMAVVKTNYTHPGREITLVRGDDGALRLLDPLEARVHDEAAEAKQTTAASEKLLSLIASGQYTSEAQLRTASKLGMSSVQRAMAELRSSGRIRKEGPRAPFEVAA